jgi:hypothetical protein
MAAGLKTKNIGGAGRGRTALALVAIMPVHAGISHANEYFTGARLWRAAPIDPQDVRPARPRRHDSAHELRKSFLRILGHGDCTALCCSGERNSRFYCASTHHEPIDSRIDGCQRIKNKTHVP